MTVYAVDKCNIKFYDIITSRAGLKGEQMNILSVVVPSFNTEQYLSNCITTLLESGDGIEILIINDGSSDGTGAIADRFAEKYPEKVKVIHQLNKGHGGAVNTGIATASGKYIKVVDSDDWVNSEALKTVVEKLKAFTMAGKDVDMFLCDFVYDKLGETKKKVMHYRGIVPENEIVTWDELGRFRAGKYILMHSVIYRREVLITCGLKLPEHTFYVDNIFVYMPLPYVETIYYMSTCVYHYFIGRDEQSVNEKNMIRRIDQQLRVNELMLYHTDLKKIKGRKRQRYMLHYLTIITTVSSVLLLKIGTKEAIEKKKMLWRSIRKYNLWINFRMRLSLVGSVINLPGITGRKISLLVYKKAQQKVGFN